MAHFFSDPEFLARLRNGDRGAFETLFHEIYPSLCDFAMRYTSSADDAEEVVSDILAKLWARPAQFPTIGSLRGYLFGAVRNRALNLRRDVRTRTELLQSRAEELFDVHKGSHFGDFDGATSENMGSVLATLIAGLPERRRTALVLRWYHGLSYAEIAEVMGISVQTVANQISRTLTDLRARFPDDLRP